MEGGGGTTETNKKVESVEGIKEKEDKLAKLKKELAEKKDEDKKSDKQKKVDKLEKQIAWRQSKADRLREGIDDLEGKKKWAERRETINNLPVIKQIRNLWRGIKYISEEYPLATTTGTLGIGGGVLAVGGGPLALIAASPFAIHALYRLYRREKEGERTGLRWIESLKETIIGPGAEEAMRLCQKRLAREKKEQEAAKKMAPEDLKALAKDQRGELRKVNQKLREVGNQKEELEEERLRIEGEGFWKKTGRFLFSAFTPFRNKAEKIEGEIGRLEKEEGLLEEKRSKLVSTLQEIENRLELSLKDKFEQFKEEVPPIITERKTNEEFSPEEEMKEIKGEAKTRDKMLKLQEEFQELQKDTLGKELEEKVRKKARKIWEEKNSPQGQSEEDMAKDWQDAIVVLKEEVEREFSDDKRNLYESLGINKEDLSWNIDSNENVSKEALKKIHKKRQEKTKEYKEKLVRQQRAIAECRNYIQKEIEDNNDIDKDVLMKWVSKFATEYGFTKGQRDEFGRHIEIYYKKRKEAHKTYEQFKNDKKELIKELFGEDTAEKLTEEKMGKMSISIDRMAILIDADLDIMNKLRSNEDELIDKRGKDKNDILTIGFHKNVGGLSVIVLGRKSILSHERQHAINSIFSEQFNNREKAVREKGEGLTNLIEGGNPEEKQKILKDYLWAVRERILGKVKDELLSTLAGFDDAKEGLAFLSDETERIPRWEKMFLEYEDYSYLKKYKIIDSDAYKKAQKMDADVCEEILRKDYKKIIKNAIESLRDLTEKYYDPKEIISLLTYQDLKYWLGVARREIGKNKAKKNMGK